MTITAIDLEAIAYTVIESGASLTEEQKTAMVDHTDWCSEGSYQKSSLEAMDDAQLAKTCLDAMQSWVNCNF